MRRLKARAIYKKISCLDAATDLTLPQNKTYERVQ